MPLNPEQYINRELSWLEFNQRVLDQALHAAVPPLERLKFLAITASNLDEFFMVRVGGLQLQRKAGLASTDPSGMTVQQQLEAVSERIAQMLHAQYQIFVDDIEPTLAASGIVRVRMKTAGLRHADAAARIMDEEILPVLSPISVSRFDAFPLLNNHELYVCVQRARVTDQAGDASQPAGWDAHSDSLTDDAIDNEPYRYAIIPLGRVLPRLITMPSDSGFAYALLEDLVCHFAGLYFPNETILAAAPFRITRNADLSLQEDSAADLLHGMKGLLQQRRTADYVRLEVVEDAPPELVEFLRFSLHVHPYRVVKARDPMDLSALMQLASLDGFDHLRDDPWTPQRSPQVDPTHSMFSTLAEKDVVLFHPYQTFEPVVRLIEEAAEDPDVLAIKQTLYRTSRRSPIVAALRKAAERGKYVTVIVELKARFDEARNIAWAQELERAGVQVIYGVKHLKTHAKVCVIVRREPQGIVRYTHFGTGNYNEVTARIYSDVSLLTRNTELGADASSFFNAVTGYSQPQKFSAIEAAPLGLRHRLLSLIEAEIDRKEQGAPGRIVAKMNSLVDPALIEGLYRASQAGVEVRLNIRGICCLKPGVPGLSDNISVISIVDRFLEHSRLIYFCHGGEDLVFISSADWMPRNLDRRVELLVPIDDLDAKRACMSALDAYFQDNQNAWALQADGSYQRLQPGDAAPFRVQQHLHQLAAETLREAERMRRTIFEPHQPTAQQID
ncbi:MAG: polyphosphate kinase 1 [Pirellulaceae bacterium]|nr:polyphosphate kinase 1 [Pirellulaceae bacterium]